MNYVSNQFPVPLNAVGKNTPGTGAKKPTTKWSLKYRVGKMATEIVCENVPYPVCVAKRDALKAGNNYKLGIFSIERCGKI